MKLRCSILLVQCSYQKAATPKMSPSLRLVSMVCHLFMPVLVKVWQFAVSICREAPLLAVFVIVCSTVCESASQMCYVMLSQICYGFIFFMVSVWFCRKNRNSGTVAITGTIPVPNVVNTVSCVFLTVCDVLPCWRRLISDDDKAYDNWQNPSTWKTVQISISSFC